tara:strand:- start:47644 stop:48510 length:867 start_codon:yes stop_codon:yes gene_type:complete
MPNSPEPIGNYVAKWGEGPVWWEGRLLYVDIEGHNVIRFDPETGAEEVWGVGERVGTVVPRSNGQMVIAGDNGFSFLDPSTGTKTPIADPEPDKKPQNRFNDGKCDPAGRFWAGTYSTIKKTGDCWLYRLEHDLSVSPTYGPVTSSNGLCWSKAADTMYYIDTPKREILAFDYDNATGNITNSRAVVDSKALGIEGSLDGMAIDVNGNLWVAVCHAGIVVCFDPETGRDLERYEFPCIETTAVAFAGENLSTLMVTTGIKPGLEEPAAGGLFALDVGVSGLPSCAFQG